MVRNGRKWSNVGYHSPFLLIQKEEKCTDKDLGA